MVDGRELLERLAKGDIDEYLINTLRLAAYEILGNLDAGKKPGADVALGLAKRNRRPISDEVSQRDFDICYRLAMAKAGGAKMAAVELELAQRHGLSTDTVKSIAKRERKKVSAEYWDRFHHVNELQAEIVAHDSVFVGLSLTEDEKEEIRSFAAAWVRGLSSGT